MGRAGKGGGRAARSWTQLSASANCSGLGHQCAAEHAGQNNQAPDSKWPQESSSPFSHMGKLRLGEGQELLEVTQLVKGRGVPQPHLCDW